MAERIGIIKTQREQIPVNLDEFEETTRLEIRNQTGMIVLAHPELGRVDRMLLRWMTGTLIRSDSEETVVRNWRNIGKSRGRDVEGGFTASQTKELNVSDNVIIGLYTEVQSYLVSSKSSLNDEIATRIADKYGHQWNDQYEARQSPKRSLELLKQNGVRISVPDQYKPLLQENCETGSCPILDKVKNIRMITINGFDNSKSSLTIHDVFDHFLFYAKLEEIGLLDKYSDFLGSVGNPQSTDIFSREGELIASVAFDYRSRIVSEPDYKPLFNLDQIDRIFRRSEKAGTLSENQQRAWSYLKNIDSDSKEGLGLPFVLSGVCIELMEQRRKNGFIRRLDEDFKPDGVLPILDPEYVALIVESHAVLYNQENKTDETLLKISVMVEDYLIGVSDGTTKGDLIMTLDTIKQFDPSNSRLTPNKVQWIKDHLGFAANRRELC